MYISNQSAAVGRCTYTVQTAATRTTLVHCKSTPQNFQFYLLDDMCTRILLIFFFFGGGSLYVYGALGYETDVTYLSGYGHAYSLVICYHSAETGTGSDGACAWRGCRGWKWGAGLPQHQTRVSKFLCHSYYSLLHCMSRISRPSYSEQ